MVEQRPEAGESHLGPGILRHEGGSVEFQVVLFVCRWCDLATV